MTTFIVFELQMLHTSSTLLWKSPFKVLPGKLKIATISQPAKFLRAFEFFDPFFDRFMIK